MNFEETYRLAVALSDERKWGEALPYFEQAVAMVPGYSQLYNNMGVAYYKTGKIDDAVKAYQAAILISPYEANAYSNLGVILHDQERHGEALAYFSFAAQLAPQVDHTYVNMGSSFVKISNFKTAEQCLDKALEINPKNAEALSNMGTVKWGMNQFENAIDYFYRALAVDSNNAIAHMNIGLVSLLLGNFDRGWREYEFRRDVAGKIVSKYREKTQWDGSMPAIPLGIYKEQGLGDHLLHSSMIPDVLNIAHDFVWETDKRLLPLYRRSFPGVKFVDSDEDMDCAAYLPMASLGYYLRASVTSIPGTPYLIADWLKREQLAAETGEGFKVGVSWASVGSEFSTSKFIPLHLWAPVTRLKANFVSLQYKASDHDVNGTPVKLTGVDCFDDIDGLAALIAACDLVITISNTTAHLAAALGKETWVLVPNGFGKFWYWGLGDTSPWYKSVRVFRQRDNETWVTVMLRVAEQLRARLPFDPLSGLTLAHFQPPQSAPSGLSASQLTSSENGSRQP